MTGEIEFFRKRFVGGFNRQDVVNYISKLAQERNDYREAKEKADQDIHALNDYIATLRIEIDALKQEVREGREYKVAALETAANTITGLEHAFEDLCGKLETAAQSVYTGLDKARDTVAALPAMLSRTGDEIKELRVACSAEKDAAAGCEAAAGKNAAAGSEVTADSEVTTDINAAANTNAGSGFDSVESSYDTHDHFEDTAG